MTKFLSVPFLGRKTLCDCVSQDFIRSTLLPSLWYTLVRKNLCHSCGHEQVPISGCVSVSVRVKRAQAWLCLAVPWGLLTSSSLGCCRSPRVLLRSSARDTATTWSLTLRAEGGENGRMSAGLCLNTFTLSQRTWQAAQEQQENIVLFLQPCSYLCVLQKLIPVLIVLSCPDGRHGVLCLSHGF